MHPAGPFPDADSPEGTAVPCPLSDSVPQRSSVFGRARAEGIKKAPAGGAFLTFLLHQGRDSALCQERDETINDYENNEVFKDAAHNDVRPDGRTERQCRFFFNLVIFNIGIQRRHDGANGDG